MAKSQALYKFQIELADIDRGVYESLQLRVAGHPSEECERLVLRVLARAIAHQEGLDFGRGLSHTDDPALLLRDAVGEVKTWIDVGCPSADRLHRASKACPRVLVFTTKNQAMLRKEWSRQSIHRGESIEVVRLPAEFVSGLAAELERSTCWYLTIQDGVVSVAQGDQSTSTAIERTNIVELLDR